MFLGLPIGVYAIVFVVFGILLIVFLVDRKRNHPSGTFSLTQMGPYRDLTLLSDKGGMAKVYHAFNSDSGRECVLKVLRSDLLGDAEIVKKFHREGEILKSIKQAHPETPVVTVYTTGTITTQFVELPFIELEYIPGRMDLSDYLKLSGRLSPEIAEKVIVQICRALTAAHEQGAVHRDLKPGNVLLYNGDPEKLVVCDFGVARQLDSRSVTLGGYGTAAYMSPEQCGGEGEITSASDIYALGLMWYEMLTGERLFEHDNPFQLMQKHKDEDPTPIVCVRIPEELQGILLQMLAKNPTSRPTMETVLSSVSGSSLQIVGYQGSGVEAITKRYENWGGTSDGSQKLIWGLSTLLLMLLCILGYQLYQNRNQTEEPHPDAILVQLPTATAMIAKDRSMTHTPIGWQDSTPIPTVPPTLAIPTRTPTTIEFPSPTVELLQKVAMGKLFVMPVPQEARVRILNIAPTYQEGMELKAGMYDVEVWQEGYEIWKERVLVQADQDNIFHPQLVRLSPTTTPLQPTPTQIPPTETPLPPTPAPEPAIPTPRNWQEGQPMTVILPGEGAIEMAMVWIPAGSFTMGSPNREKNRNDNEGPQHQVTLTQGFWMGKYEVTQRQWQAVMGNNPSNFPGENRPVEKVSWNDCQAFFTKLNEGSPPGFRLPSEAEWEYACRSGKETRFYWGDDANEILIHQYAWYEKNSGNQTHDVGSKSPNAWGLHDMSGNVWEWCQDWYDDYKGDAQINPIYEASGSYRVNRGGSWINPPRFARSSYRYRSAPTLTFNHVGFRVVYSRPH